MKKIDYSKLRSNFKCQPVIAFCLIKLVTCKKQKGHNYSFQYQSEFNIYA